MFGQKPIPRRRHSQLFSRRRRGVCSWVAWVALLVALVCGWLGRAPEAMAQTTTTTAVSREAVDQSRSNRSQPDQTQFDFNPEPGFWKRLFENLHASYGVTLMGPRFLGASNETYNLYVPDVAPIQLYHSASVSFQVTPDFRVGFGLDIVQDIADDVVGETGIRRGQKLTIYDPTVNFSFPNPFQIPGWWVSNSASFSLSVTDYSMNLGRVTQLNYWSNWRINTYPSPWGYGFDINLNPQFYTQPFPDPSTGIFFRKTFYASIGSTLSYQVSPVVSLVHTTTFDFAHYEGRDTGFFNFNSDLADRTRFSIIVSPNVYPMYLSISGYIQALIFDLRPETTITGLGLNISF